MKKIEVSEQALETIVAMTNKLQKERDMLRKELLEALHYMYAYKLVSVAEMDTAIKATRKVLDDTA